MEIIQQLSLIAFHQVLGDRAASILSFLDDRFSDNGQRLTRAVHTANVRAWKSLEIALCGSSWWKSCANLLSSRAEQNFRKQVQAFLETVPLPQLPGGRDDFRERCLKELKAASKARLIPGDDVPTDALARQTRALAERVSPENLLRAEFEAVEGMARTLHDAGHPALAQYVSLRPGEGKPLLVVGVRFFFRREVELDPKLSAGLTFQQLEGISAAQEAGFRDLGDALREHGERMEELLGNVAALVADTHQDVREMRSDVQDIRDLIEERLPAGAGPDPATSSRIADTHQDVREMRSEVQRLGALLEQRSQESGGGEEVRLLRAQLEEQSKQIQDLVSVIAKAMEHRTASVPAPLPPAPAAPAPVPEASRAAPPEVAPPAPVRAPVPEAPPPVSPAPVPMKEAVPMPVGTGWEQVRSLLGKAKSLTREEQRQSPELFRAVGKLKRAAQQYETTRRTILRLTDTCETEPVADALPVINILPSVVEPAAGSDRSASGSSGLRRVKGPLVSSLFQAKDVPAGTPPAPAEAAPQPPAVRGRPTSKLLSPLFQQAQGQPPAEENAEGAEKKEEEPPAKKRGGLLSPLFAPPPADEQGRK